jgi:hypothetical protein
VPTETEAHDGTMVVCDCYYADACVLKACPSLLLRSLEPAAAHVCRQPRSSWSLSERLHPDLKDTAYLSQDDHCAWYR